MHRSYNFRTHLYIQFGFHRGDTEMVTVKFKKMIFKAQIKETPDSHDSNDVYYWNEDETRRIGYAYQTKEDLTIHVMTCPNCRLENYGPQKHEGSCYACGFDPNEKQKND